MGSVRGIGLWLVGLFCVLPFSAPRAGAQMRTWTSTEATTLEADLPSGTADSVTIRRVDGCHLAFYPGQLSSANSEWVVRQPAQQSEPLRKYTKIWGKDGELWDPGDDTLLDFSYAGYHEGRNDFPQWKVGVNVRRFGAKGDGQTDDTEAFRKAVEACPDKRVVFIPSGTYRLTDWIAVEETIDFAFRGESRDRTVLLLGVGLEQIHPREAKTGHGRPTTSWSWEGGFLWFEDCIEVGVENLTVKGNGEQYDVHWKERGYNGVYFRNVEDAWVREVTFLNVDSGIFTDASRHVTIENVLFESTPEWPSTSQFEDNYGVSGHHGISFGHGSCWCVADRVVFKNRFHHEIGLSGESHHCVYSNVTGPNLHFDFHTQEDNIHDVLFTEIDVGEGELIWDNNFYGACTGAVLWNIKGRRLSLPVEKPWLKHPVRAEDLKTLLVGWPIDLPDEQQRGRPWFEDIAPEEIEPQNIYHAQRRRRLAGMAQPSVPKADVTPGQPDGTKRKRRWWQFGLPTLLVLVLICAIPCSWLAVKMYRARKRRKMVEASPG